MRNILQYPIEKQEMLDWLDKRYDEWHSKEETVFGGTEGGIIMELQKLVREEK